MIFKFLVMGHNNDCLFVKFFGVDEKWMNHFDFNFFAMISMNSFNVGALAFSSWFIYFINSAPHLALILILDMLVNISF